MCYVALRISTPTYQNVMTKYTHLTQEQRYHISALKQTNISQAEIARRIGVHKSTISRELKRNKGKKSYCPKQAHTLATKRKAKNSATITKFVWCYIAYLLRKKYFLKQITGRLKILGWQDIPSHERIYQYIYADKKQGGDLYTHLRCQKTYRKRSLQGQDRRGQIVNRKDIDERPSIIKERSRIGDYEGDTVVGKGFKGVVVTLVDRVTKIKALPNRTADKVSNACIEMLRCENAYSITFDNGKEFAQHENIASELNLDIYFAKPYHSWKRGTNENTNRLIRQFLPKSMRLDNVSNDFIQAVEDNLNNRPRKSLGFLTPLEVKSRNGCVALHC